MGMGEPMMMFDVMSFFVPLVFIIVFGFIIFSIGKGVSEWSSNNKKPRLTVPAGVVSKRTKVSGGHGNTSAHTHYFATFEVESGDRMEFNVNGSEFGQLAEGDVGELAFQGTRFHQFVRRREPVENSRA